MSSFTKAHAAIVYDPLASRELGKDHWRNLGMFRYYIGEKNSDEWVTVNAGALSDGASVPFPCNALIPAWGSYSQAVLLHDVLCNTYYKFKMIGGVAQQVPITRTEIDAILAEAMVVLNVHPARRNLINAGVSLYRWLRNPKRPVPNPARVRLEAMYDPTDFDY